MMPFKIIVKSHPVNKPMRRLFQLSKACLFTLSFIMLSTAAKSEELKFGLPIKCNINKDCFIQNLPDLISGKAHADSFCGGATYNNHKGVDIRLLSLKDIKRNVPVIAAADGIVKAFRDGEPDQLVRTPDQRKRVKNKECGNGVVLTHGARLETQYCHIKQGSISLKRGQVVKKGEVIGFVGNSGFAAFPHVHFGIRMDGQWLDPVLGKRPSDNCSVASSQSSMLDKLSFSYFSENTSQLLTSGITGNVFKHSSLVKSGAPKALVQGDKAIIGWAWFINLRKGDQIRFTLEGPEGIISQNTTKPIDRHKADYSGFSGKKRLAQKGEYTLRTQLLRKGNVIKDSLYVKILE